MSPLVLGEVLVVFVNRMTAESKYAIQDYQNLQLPIQMKLSEQGKTFSLFFVQFQESTPNVTHFEKTE